MLQPLALRLSSLVPLSHAEIEALQRIVANAVRVEADEELVREGSRFDGVLIVQDGLACRYRLLPGGQRQITAYLIPGDLFGLQLGPADTMTSSLGTLTACSVVRVARSDVAALMGQHAGLAQALRAVAAIDEAVLNEWLVNIGRRTSFERIAHLLAELLVRFRAVGIARDDGFDFPMTQVDLADTVALSAVHVNRTLQALRAEHLIRWERRRLTVLDVDRLAALAMFNPAYLGVACGVTEQRDAGPDRLTA